LNSFVDFLLKSYFIINLVTDFYLKTSWNIHRYLRTVDCKTLLVCETFISTGGTSCRHKTKTDISGSPNCHPSLLALFCTRY